ncbi:MAG: hypothetical protein ACFFB5_24180, partial [Promethearchaeota archaeon]
MLFRHMRKETFSLVLVFTFMCFFLFVINIPPVIASSYEYTFTDDFNSLNNWSNAAIAPYTVGGAMTTG